MLEKRKRNLGQRYSSEGDGIHLDVGEPVVCFGLHIVRNSGLTLVDERKINTSETITVRSI